jgi:hypothetical protein
VGAALRCVTLTDCLPTDKPPPMRLAETSCAPITIAQTRSTDHNLLIVPSLN